MRLLELRMLHKLKATTWLNLRTISLLVVYALFWLFIGLIAHNGLERQVFLVLAQTTGGLVADSVAGEFSVQDFASGFSLDQLNQLDRQFANYSGKNVQEIKIFNLQGRVLYANDKSDVGKIEFNDLKLIEPKRTTASLDGERLVLFVPIQAGPEPKTVGTLEVYLAGGAVIRFLNYLQLITWLFVVVSAFLMLTAIHMVIRRATVTINDTNETMASLNERLAESNAYLNQTGVGTVRAFLSALDAKDRYTAQHSVNVATYVEKIARKLGLTPQDLELVREAALLHDIGKIGVPENVLNKPGKLNSDEYEMIKRHSEIGAEIIHSIYFLEEVAEIIRYHHERVDGSGYPKGMVGEEIPLTARILAVADVYDALTTDRPYRKAMSPQQAKAILVAEAGKNFDPAVVKALCAVIAEEVAA